MADVTALLVSLLHKSGTQRLLLLLSNAETQADESNPQVLPCDTRKQPMLGVESLQRCGLLYAQGS